MWKYRCLCLHVKRPLLNYETIHYWSFCPQPKDRENVAWRLLLVFTAFPYFILVSVYFVEKTSFHCGDWERLGQLDPSNFDLFCLHFTVFWLLESTLSDFADGWNSHPSRTEKNLSPFQFFSCGILELQKQTISVMSCIRYPCQILFTCCIFIF